MNKIRAECEWFIGVYLIFDVGNIIVYYLLRLKVLENGQNLYIVLNMSNEYSALFI